VEAVSDELTSADLAKTLWALVKMGRKPGEKILGMLEVSVYLLYEYKSTNTDTCGAGWT
jgi:hypothetical protein